MIVCSHVTKVIRVGLLGGMRGNNFQTKIVPKQFLQALDYPENNNNPAGKLEHIHALLAKHEVKMAGHWPSSFYAILWTETKSMSIKTQKKNEANIQPS